MRNEEIGFEYAGHAISKEKYFGVFRYKERPCLIVEVLLWGLS
jgi:hypothetical protein